MREIDRICAQMKRALEGEAWHGPSLLEILGDVNAREAAAKPDPGVHSIWEIALHLLATQELMLSRLAGVSRQLTPEEDWPPAPEPTAEGWEDACDRLRRGEERLRASLAAFPEERLSEPLVTPGSSAYNNFHGHVQHNLYHAGQMMLLKKMVRGT